MNPRICLLTLKVRPELIDETLFFYSSMGFEFKQEIEGNRPIFYRSTSNGYTLEIEPLLKDDGYPQPKARLGFLVSREIIHRMIASKIEVFEKPYGWVTNDPQGRFVQLHLVENSEPNIEKPE